MGPRTVQSSAMRKSQNRIGEVQLVKQAKSYMHSALYVHNDTCIHAVLVGLRSSIVQKFLRFGCSIIQNRTRLELARNLNIYIFDDWIIK